MISFRSTPNNRKVIHQISNLTPKSALRFLQATSRCLEPGYNIGVFCEKLIYVSMPANSHPLCVSHTSITHRSHIDHTADSQFWVKVKNSSPPPTGYRKVADSRLEKKYSTETYVKANKKKKVFPKLTESEGQLTVTLAYNPKF